MSLTSNDFEMIGKDISKLQYASMVGCFTLLYTAIIIAAECPMYYNQAIKEQRTIPLFKPLSMKVFDSFSIFLYAFFIKI